MKNCVFILLSLFQLNVWSQDVDIMLYLSSYDDKRPVINQEIWLISETDTLIQKTNLQGLVVFSTQDSIQPLKLNQRYGILSKNIKGAIFKNDSVDTYVTKNARIVRDFLIYNSNELYLPKIFFEKENWAWAAEDTKTLNGIHQLLDDNENLIILIHSMINDFDAYTQGEEISKVVRDSLIARGFPAERLQYDYPHHMDSSFQTKDHITFAISSFEYYPCVGHNVINFDSQSNFIVETRCDSIQFIYNTIMGSKDIYALIGIYYNRDDSSQIEIARKRAELVQEILVKMGVPKNRMEVFTQYYPAPKKDDYRDWPFYPLNYTYEIGVVLNLAP